MSACRFHWRIGADDGALDRLLFDEVAFGLKHRSIDHLLFIASLKNMFSEYYIICVFFSPAGQRSLAQVR